VRLRPVRQLRAQKDLRARKVYDRAGTEAAAAAAAAGAALYEAVVCMYVYAAVVYMSRWYTIEKNTRVQCPFSALNPSTIQP
jgi:hypothetical protein